MFKNFTIKKQYYCLVCFKNLLEISTFQSLSFFHPTLCETCFKKLEVANFQMEFHHYSIQILFYYNDFLKSLIYQFKGCYDIALAPIFLDYHLKQLKQKYKGYVIVYPPSYEKENQKRGFQHVKEMVKTLNLPIYDIFYKNKDYKQSSTPFSLRKNIQSIIEFKNTKVLENQ